jgi:large subunit ribosomal protein L20
MPRAIDGTKRKKRRQKLLKHAKGYWGRRSNLYRTAKDAVAKSLSYAYRDRRNKKRSFRALWITRISAACRQQNMSYSSFIHGLELAGVQINRKALSNLAIEDPKAFSELVAKAKEAIGAQVKK